MTEKCFLSPPLVRGMSFLDRGKLPNITHQLAGLKHCQQMAVESSRNREGEGLRQGKGERGGH